jgi:hypothetical protein
VAAVTLSSSLQKWARSFRSVIGPRPSASSRRNVASEMSCGARAMMFDSPRTAHECKAASEAVVPVSRLIVLIAVQRFGNPRIVVLFLIVAAIIRFAIAFILNQHER